MTYFYLFIAVLAEVTATSALKASEEFTRLIPSIIVVSGYAMAFYFMTLTLRVIPVGITYAVWSGLGIVFVTIISFFLYKQSLDIPAVIGIGLIIVGVIVINLFSNTIGH
ncbi:MAG: QacE family quaternary ammonium compound efflux SMR transporter [Deltaproteobacteria bacterium]|nr:MAG: QacE family quaternary ammonium compound efflux SMR transporter [Deltaproteobacteria bacterium]